MEQNRLKEAEGRLHRALASDIPAERKRKPQELLIWTYMEQGRPQEALPIVQSLRPLDDKERPTEKGLAAILEVLCHAEELEQAKGSHKAFLTLFPKSPYLPRVELAWGRLLGKSGEAKESAQVLRRLIKSHPEAPQADDARLALASLLTDGSLKDVKDMPTAESLLAAVRKGGRAIPKGAGQVVELRLLCGKSQWEEALDLVDRMDPAARTTHPEVKQLWTDAWQAWTAQALEKKALGPLLARMRPGSFGALEPKTRQVALGLLAEQGLLSVIPRLIKEAPSSERGSLRAGALAKVEPESQPEAVVALLPARGGTPEERLARARAQAVLGQWPGLRESLVGAKPGPERIRALLLLLRRPLGPKERPAARLGEAEGWLQKAPEPGPAREPLAILVADLRFQAGDPKGALALYPAHPAAADQRGWVGLMRAQALLALGRPRESAVALKEVRDEAGFKAQRDVLAKGLGAY